MGSFTSSLKTEWIPGAKNWRVSESFRFYSGEPDSGIYVQINRGMVTDLASIPRIARLLVPKVGSDAQASVVHDELYRSGMVTASVSVNGIEHKSLVPISRGMADGLFHQAMMALKVGRLRRKALYYGVVCGGWMAWNRYRSQGHGTSTETTR